MFTKINPAMKLFISLNLVILVILFNGCSQKSHQSQLDLVTIDSTKVVVKPETGRVIIAAASWCPHARSLVATLNDPELQSYLKNLQITFVFMDEWNYIQKVLEEQETPPEQIKAFRDELGSYNLPVILADPTFLSTLPGDYFFATGEIPVTSTPSRFSQDTGTFDKHALFGFVEAGVPEKLLLHIYEEYDKADQ